MADFNSTTNAQQVMLRVHPERYKTFRLRAHLEGLKIYQALDEAMALWIASKKTGGE